MDTTSLPADAARTVGALRASGHVEKSVKAELRDNLLARMREGTDRFPGIIGFAATVLPQVERALLAGHDIVLLASAGTQRRESPAATSTTMTRSRRLSPEPT